MCSVDMGVLGSAMSAVSSSRNVNMGRMRYAFKIIHKHIRTWMTKQKTDSKYQYTDSIEPNIYQMGAVRK